MVLYIIQITQINFSVNSVAIETYLGWLQVVLGEEYAYKKQCVVLGTRNIIERN